MHGVSTRSVDDPAKAVGMTGISKSQVSPLCEEIDDKVTPVSACPIGDRCPRDDLFRMGSLTDFPEGLFQPRACSGFAVCNWSLSPYSTRRIPPG